MDIVVGFSAIIAVALMAFAYWTCRAMRPAREWVATLTVLLGVTCGLIAFWGEFSVSGHTTVPVPGVNIPSVGKFALLGFKLDPNVAIYVLLDVPGGPILYRLPWNKDQAEQMQRMQQQGQQMDVETGDPGKGGAPRAGDSPSSSQGIRVEGRPDPRSTMPDKEPESPGQTFQVGG
jgi:hypothetical protein